MNGEGAPKGAHQTPAKRSGDTLAEGTDDLADFRATYSLGYGTGYDVGYVHGGDDRDAEWSSAFTGCTDLWRRPRQAETEGARVFVPGEPCRTRCRACSRCVHSLAWWARGGRDFLGVDAERVLAGAS